MTIKTRPTLVKNHFRYPDIWCNGEIASLRRRKPGDRISAVGRRPQLLKGTLSGIQKCLLILIPLGSATGKVSLSWWFCISPAFLLPYPGIPRPGPAASHPALSPSLPFGFGATWFFILTRQEHCRPSSDEQSLESNAETAGLWSYFLKIRVLQQRFLQPEQARGGGPRIYLLFMDHKDVITKKW